MSPASSKVRGHSPPVSRGLWVQATGLRRPVLTLDPGKCLETVFDSSRTSIPTVLLHDRNGYHSSPLHTAQRVCKPWGSPAPWLPGTSRGRKLGAPVSEQALAGLPPRPRKPLQCLTPSARPAGPRGQPCSFQCDPELWPYRGWGDSPWSRGSGSPWVSLVLAALLTMLAPSCGQGCHLSLLQMPPGKTSLHADHDLSLTRFLPGHGLGPKHWGMPSAVTLVGSGR